MTCTPTRRAARRRTVRDTAARNDLVEANLPLVNAVLSRMGLERRSDRDDLAQVATIGLARAAEIWNEATDPPWVTFAARWIRAFVVRELKRSDMVRIPERAAGGDRWEVRRRLLVSALSGRRDAPATDVVDRTQPQPHDSAWEAQRAAEVGDAIAFALDELACEPSSARLAEILGAYYLRGESLALIGGRLSMSSEAVRTLKRRGLRKLGELCPWLKEYMPADPRPTR